MIRLFYDHDHLIKFDHIYLFYVDLSEGVKRKNIVEVLYDKLDDAVLDKRQVRYYN